MIGSRFLAMVYVFVLVAVVGVVGVVEAGNRTLWRSGGGTTFLDRDDGTWDIVLETQGAYTGNELSRNGKWVYLDMWKNSEGEDSTHLSVRLGSDVVEVRPANKPDEPWSWYIHGGWVR